MCSQTDADPGPPLNENISGRFVGGLSSRVRHEKQEPFSFTARRVLDRQKTGGNRVIQLTACD